MVTGSDPLLHGNHITVINWDMTAGVETGANDKSYGVAFVGDKGTVLTDRHSYRVIPEWDGSLKKYKIDAKHVTYCSKGW